MDTSYYLIFATVAIIYSAYLTYKSESARNASLHKRHSIQYPSIDFQYDRFNTKKDRNTTVEKLHERLKVTTDVQSIIIANYNLVVRVESQYEGIDFGFDIIIQPFDKSILELEGYTNYISRNDEILILWSYGVHTKRWIEAVEGLKGLYTVIPSDPAGVFVDLSSFTIDRGSNAIEFYGKLKDGNELKVVLDYEAHVLNLSAPKASIMNVKNFTNVKNLNDTELY